MKKVITQIIVILLLLSVLHSVTVKSSESYQRGALSYSRNIVMSTSSINQLNESIEEKIPSVESVFYKDSFLEGDSLKLLINSLSIVPSSPRYSEKRILLTHSYYDFLQKNMNLPKENNYYPISYGIVVKRTALKLFPTNDKAYSSYISKYDRFLESTLYVGEPVAVLHESLDSNWYFIRMYNYVGWVHQKDIALCSKEVITLYSKSPNYITITSAHTISKNSQTQLDLGSRIPLLSVDTNYDLVGLIPAKNSSGQLFFIKDAISRIDCTKNSLPYTTENLMKIAFKLIGEPYGWGGDNNARDCSSYVMDVFRVFGINLPRNTDQQENIPGKMTSIHSHADFVQLDPGSLLFMKGHVMIYVGEYHGMSYIIHDTPGYYSGGKFINANGVTITPTSIYSSSGLSYEKMIYKAVTIK